MKRTTYALALAAALGTLLSACGSGGGQEQQPATNAGVVQSTPTSSAPAPSSKAPATTAPAAPSTPALEAAFVAEVMGEQPALGLARAELITMGHTTCDAFRAKPGTVATLVKNATAAGQTAEAVETLRVMAVAAIHNLCTDQSGDL